MCKIEKFVVVCHGEHHRRFGGSLTNKGYAQVSLLADLLFERGIKGKDVCILSSKANRAEETSTILAIRLQVPNFDLFDCLGPGKSSSFISRNHNEFLRLVENMGRRHKFVVVSAHPEHVDLLPTIWANSFKLEIPIARGSPNGTARVVCLSKREAESIRPGVT